MMKTISLLVFSRVRGRGQADKSLISKKAGDGDRTRDVQPGKMEAVCLSKTSLFNTFIQSYGKTANDKPGHPNI
jgi:hypothetical protein